MPQFDMNLMDRLAFAARRCPERAADMMQSFKYNQIVSKMEAVHLLPHATMKVCVLGGWYGIGVMLTNSKRELSFDIIDIDPMCKHVGELIDYPNYAYHVADALTYDTSNYNYILNCSAEHMDRDLLHNSFTTVSSGTRYIIQSNNNRAVPEHINCFDSCEDFVDYLSHSFAIEKTFITTMDNGSERYTVLCRKM